MIRVQSIIMKSGFADEMSTQVSDLQEWTKHILDGAFAAIVSSPSINKHQTVANFMIYP